MQISYDTNSGVVSTTFDDYVSGLSVPFSLAEGQSPQDFAQSSLRLQAAVDVLHDHLHDTYSIIDGVKGKVIKKALRASLAAQEDRLSQVFLSTEIFDMGCSCGECDDGDQLSLELEIEELREVATWKGREIRESAVIKSVVCTPRGTLIINIGVLASSVPFMALEMMALDLG